MNKRNWLILLVIVIALALRVYRLGDVPHGMTWDEAAIGYNGFAVITTRHDEWLERLPISFRSFGDYKAPLAIYLNGIFTFIFGMNLWAVRLPFALSGVAAVLGVYLLIEVLFKSEKQAQIISFIGALLLALSPWHHHFSRVGFESGLALTMIIWATYFLLFFLLEKKHKLKKVSLLFSSLLFVLSLYTYHSSKVFVPIFLIIILCLKRKELFTQLIKNYLLLIPSVLAVLPLLNDSFFGEGLTRANSTVFSETGFVNGISQVIVNFSAHLTPGFLFMGNTDSLRHSDGQWGVLLITTGILAGIGIAASFLDRKKKLSFQSKLGITWFLVGIIPAAIGTDVPHPNRALLALPGIIILACVGAIVIFEKIKSDNVKSIAGLIIGVHFLLFASYMSDYYKNFSKNSAEDFKDGYIEAFEIAENYEKGTNGYPKVDQIIFTSRYGQPYIYALFVRETNPIWYRGGSLNTYLFMEQIGMGDLSRKNTLVVGTSEDDLPFEKADHVVLNSAEKPAFYVFKTE